MFEGEGGLPPCVLGHWGIKACDNVGFKVVIMGLEEVWGELVAVET